LAVGKSERLNARTQRQFIAAIRDCGSKGFPHHLPMVWDANVKMRLAAAVPTAAAEVSLMIGGGESSDAIFRVPTVFLIVDDFSLAWSGTAG
jgi:hypothetical protein